MTEDERNEQLRVRSAMMAEIRRLRDVCKNLKAERDDWRSMYESERADHLATLEHTNKMLAEDYP